MANRLLIVSDREDALDPLKPMLQESEWSYSQVADLNQAHIRLIEEDYNPHVMFCDANELSDQEQSLLHECHQYLEGGEIIFLRTDNTEALHGDLHTLAFDVLRNDADHNRYQMAVTKALRSAKTKRRLQTYSSADTQRYQLDSFVGTSDPVKSLREMLKRLSEVPISAMVITGETGTGKGLVARILHTTGLRNQGPMVELNCAALPHDLLESQLFGHEAGAFTGARTRYRGLFEQADGGTLFLDEIGDMHMDLQAKLLKAIEDKKIRRLGSESEFEVDVQIIAATSLNLEEEAKKGNFRSDLFHRLSVFCVSLPPLRERTGDLLELVPRIIAEYNSKAGRKVETIPDEAWDRMMHHQWPGNVRELRNVLERCVLMATDDTLPLQWLQLADICDPDTGEDCNMPTPDSLSIPLDGSMALEEMDKHIIQSALEKNDYNIMQTARMLKTTRETLRYRIQKYALKLPA